MKAILKLLIHSAVIILLTLLTQIGGLIYMFTLGLNRLMNHKSKTAFIRNFVILYLLSTFLIVPLIAPLFGREKIKSNAYIKAHNFFYPLMNRNYVTPELQSVLSVSALKVQNDYHGYYIHYLDANFPFINGFPLIPHLSHNDGKKIDISFVYEDSSGKITNKTSSLFGYGVYENEMGNDSKLGSTQVATCINQGYWQYDLAKYLSFGYRNSEALFSNTANKSLLNNLCAQPAVSKIFIEPHLKTRLNLTNSKIRFHGCWAVRHDDHIHIEL